MKWLTGKRLGGLLAVLFAALAAAGLIRPEVAQVVGQLPGVLADNTPSVSSSSNPPATR